MPILSTAPTVTLKCVFVEEQYLGYTHEFTGLGSSQEPPPGYTEPCATYYSGDPVYGYPCTVVSGFSQTCLPGTLYSAPGIDPDDLAALQATCSAPGTWFDNDSVYKECALSPGRVPGSYCGFAGIECVGQKKWRLCGNCYTCPPGYTFDPVSRRCLSAPCPPGQCFCDVNGDGIGECIPCPVQCKEQLNCRWQPTGACYWSCDHPVCLPTERWDWVSCYCQPCPPGKCWCEGTRTCVPCTDPPCKTQLRCRWSTRDCRWLCDDPTAPGYCPPGKTWNQRACRCVPDCPAGQCWCENTQNCVPCPRGQCHQELHCVWDVDQCAYACDDSATICGQGRSWDPVLCECDGGRPANLITEDDQYHVARPTPDGIRYQRSDHSVPPPEPGSSWAADVYATALARDWSPALYRNWRRELVLLLTRAGGSGYTAGVLEARSRDDGRTWSEPEMAISEGKLPVGRAIPGTNAEFQAAWVDGKIRARIKYPGELQWSEEWTFQERTADNRLVDLLVADRGFDIAMEPDGTRRWLLAAYREGETELRHWVSTDEVPAGKTWREVGT